MFNGNGESPNSQLLQLARKFNCFYLEGRKKNKFKQFYIMGRQIGLVRPEVEAELIHFPDVFHVTEDAIVLNPNLTTYEDRSEAIEAVLRSLRDKNLFVALKGDQDKSALWSCTKKLHG